ncbi:MAG: N-acetylmuramoyl-L-alanine amidase [Burkholderiales bacterium]|jgi:N-acetylmuramoyl-L-alanine amidase
MFEPIVATAALNGPASSGKPRLAEIFSTLVLLVFAFIANAGAAERISAIRVWPAQDYTRITIEASQPIRHELLLVKNPDRLVLDLEGVDFDSVQREISGKILPSDPYIGQMRAGRYKPGVVRVVLDLKTEVKPQIFMLEPVGDYGHRLVLDVYPLVPIDPLMALLQKPEVKAGTGASTTEVALPATQDAAAPEVGPAPSGKTEPAVRAKPVVSRLVTIVVDAGHGGEDPGAKGRGGSREKNVTLTIARKLKAIIDAEPNMRAVLTRDGDYFIPLQVRVQKARRVHADLFVSVHADAFVGSHARGSSVFALSERGATSTAAKLLAKRENDADLIGGVDLNVKDRYLAMTLADLSLTAQINDSLKLGKAVLSELGGVNDLHKGRVEQAGFAVLKAPDIPSILVETAFISNPDEERKLNDEAYQEKMAQAIFKGIKRYFTKNPPLSRSTVAALDKAD